MPPAPGLDTGVSLAMTSMFQMSSPPGHPKTKASSAPPPTAPKRHCWECLRRRLVCDSGTPYCRKCVDGGVVCPGYEDKKPLRWIANGQVSSRPRQSRSAPATAAAGRAKQPPRATVVSKKKQQHATQHEMQISLPERSGCLGILPHMDTRSTTWDVVQAAYYYNTWVLPTYDSALELAPNPFIAPFPLEILPYLTDGLRHTVVALAIGHRIHQLPKDASRGASVDLWSRLFHHRLLAIRELSHDIASEDTRASDNTIVTIILFLFVELQQMPATNWRQHLDGLTQLIEIRGGAREFLKTLPALAIGMSSFFLVGVMANTTCPPLCDNSAASHYALLDLLGTMYGEGGYPTCLCPPSLFVTVVEINYLRAQQARANLLASTSCAGAAVVPNPLLLTSDQHIDLPLVPQLEHGESDESSTPSEAACNTAETPATSIQTIDSFSPANQEGPDMTTTPAAQPLDIDANASRLLKDILAFSPAEFSTSSLHSPQQQHPTDSSSRATDRLVLGRLWQSALVIYLIASLQSAGALRRSSFRRGQLGGLRAVHGQRLYEQLQLAVVSERLKRSVLWPLVVCGFDAAEAVNSAVSLSGTGGGSGDESRSAAAAERRKFVETRLPILGHDVGTSLPDYARVVLRKFWDSGRADWDGCFDGSYAFVT
ncbi:fungal-specific transcription factor domain-domain-containing protein [Microdochium bolleyi]|uniref:Fungal-specific transcription factor domain-domain-containing protein n=1 Tax=Microdochium bolleyi TaxID=196109 RepID=A0A136IYH2_9PEZI|nr:fungal-specific transcription factor domain-domain-containing protein [Microdochium bolleyi]